MPLFFWLLYTAAKNAYIILSRLDKSWENKHKSFIVSLAWDLVKQGGLTPQNNQVLLQLLPDVREGLCVWPLYF